MVGSFAVIMKTVGGGDAIRSNYTDIQYTNCAFRGAFHSFMIAGDLQLLQIHTVLYKGRTILCE